MSGLIYLLSDDKPLYYVGKNNGLYDRRNTHRSNIKYQGSCSSKFLDISFNYTILEEQIEEENLKTREQYWINFYKETYGDKCLNIRNAIPATEESKCLYRKKYYQTHREMMLNYVKHWQETHKEKLIEIQKKYYENNKDYIRNYQRNYQQKYRENKKKECLEKITV